MGLRASRAGGTCHSRATSFGFFDPTLKTAPVSPPGVCATATEGSRRHRRRRLACAQDDRELLEPATRLRLLRHGESDRVAYRSADECCSGAQACPRDWWGVRDKPAWIEAPARRKRRPPEEQRPAGPQLYVAAMMTWSAPGQPVGTPAGLRTQSPCCSRLWTVKSLRSGGFGKARSPSCWMTGMSLSWVKRSNASADSQKSITPQPRRSGRPSERANRQPCRAG